MAEKLQSIGVTLLSGGLDSTTVAAYAKGRVERLTALTFRYGQTHSKEVRCATEIAQSLGIAHEVVDISAFGKVAWYSALTSPERYAMAQDRFQKEAEIRPGETGQGIPITYVPLRNTLFLTMAAAFLESQALHTIEVERVDPHVLGTHIFLAPNVIDYSGYPDCRPEYYDRMRDALMYGSKLWTQYHVPIRIETPVIQLSKADIVKLGMELKAPLERTWSCYQDGELPCGRCDSCVFRARGFEEAGHKDPLLVRLGVGTT